MTLKRLLAYCKEKGIFVPGSATKEYVEAAIVRAHYNGREVEDQKGCFGLWQEEDSNCVLCDWKDKCFSASLGGIDREKYMRAFERLENPKIRLTNSSPRFSRRSRKR